MGVDKNAGSLTPASGRKKRDANDQEAKQFANLLGEETEKVEDGKKNETGKALIEGESEKPGKEPKKLINQEKAKMEAKNRELQEKLQQQVRKKLTKMNPALNYIYNIMYKNPDTLSLSEKQAFKLVEQSGDKDVGVGLKEFSDMLKHKGLKMRDLSLRDFSKLISRKGRSQIDAYLDKVANDKRNGLLEQREEPEKLEKDKGKVDEKQVAERSEKPGARLENISQLNEALKADPTKQTEKTARQVKREEVIDQIIKHIEVRNIGEMTDLKIRLNPEYLGELKMNITFEDGRMTTRFETTSREVRQLLKDSLEELKGEMRKKGLKIDRADVKLVDSME